MDAILGLRMLSFSVRSRPPRATAKRVNRTSLGVCSRDEVVVNMFSGEK